jgi:hypothetical protein
MLNLIPLSLLKPSLAQLLDGISEKLVLAHIKGSQMEEKKIYLTQTYFSFCVVLGLHGKIVPPPIMGQSKFFWGKFLIF